MLLDMLGILVGFMAVMLLLSLVVTALTEFLQSLLRLRPRNLTFCLTSLLEQALAPAPGEAPGENGAEPAAAPASAAPPDPRQAGKLARGIMRLHRFQPRRQAVTAGAGVSAGVAAAIAPAPPLSSIDLQAVQDGLVRQGVELSPRQAERLERLCPEAQASMRARFERNVKRVAFALAVLVAFVMQVSSLSLLSRLADDAEFRARAVAAGERLADAGEGGDGLILSPRSYEEVSEAALADLQRRHPEEAEYLEQASGIGASRTDILAELDLILREESHPNRTALLEEYARLLDAEHRRSIGRSLAQLGRNEAELAALDIRPWHSGWAYYREWENVLGVAITAILISLGAPFWHDLLRKTVSVLRDVRPEPARPAGYGSGRVAVAEEARPPRA